MSVALKYGHLGLRGTAATHSISIRFQGFSSAQRRLTLDAEEGEDVTQR